MISHPYVRFISGQILWLISYLSVESILYAYVMFTEKEVKDKMKNSVAKLIMKVCVFLFDFMIFLGLKCFSNIYLMFILFNHCNNTIKKNEYDITHEASEGMSTPQPKINEAVGR